MGLDTVSVLSYGFTVPQSKVLELLQKLKLDADYNSNMNEDEARAFMYEDAEILQELLEKHLKDGGINTEGFSMRVLQEGDEFEGLAMLYNGMYDSNGEQSYGVKVRPYYGEKFMPLLSRPWNNGNLIEDADAALKRLQENSLFKELGIEVDPQWLLGASQE